MSWTLVSTLAIPGVMMGLLSVRGHTRGIEPYLWVVLAIFAALVIARSGGQRFFLYGLAVGVAWGLLNGLVAATFFSIYAQHNPEVMRSIGAGAGGVSPRVMFAVGAPFIGLATGLALGGLSWAASFLMKPAPPPG